MRRRGWLLLVVAALSLAAREARAQETRSWSVEGTVGVAGFPDDETKAHAVFGGALRVPVTPRTSIGPEFMYMVGPDTDRDTFVMGSVWFDLLSPRPGTYASPFLVASAGYMHHRNEFLGATFSGGAGAYSGGGGLRCHFGDRVYAGADVRIGWELQLRATAHVGVRLGAR